MQSPQSQAELCAAISDAAKSGACVITAPYNFAPPDTERKSVQLDLSGLNRVIEHQVADQVINVEAGMKISDLNKLLLHHRQMLPLSVPAHRTLIDAALSADAGDLEHGYGGMRDLVLGMSLALADGTAIKCGGRVVKNVSGYDVSKLIVGSQGWLAVPISFHLRLYATPETSLTMLWSFDSLWRAMNQAKELWRSGLPFASLEMMPRQLVDGAGGRFVLAVRVMSLSAVCDEMRDAATQIAGQPELLLAAEESDAFWAKLQAALAAPGPMLKVLSAPSVIPSVAEALAAGALWSARPSKGKLMALVRSLDDSLAELNALCRKTNEPLLIAAPDKQYHYRVRQLPEDDPTVSELKRSIKVALDPEFTLNPYVLP